MLEFYAALRRRGFSIDILPTNAPLDGYSLIVAPSLPVLDDDLVDRLSATQAQVIVGPRTGSKTCDLHIPAGLPPGLLQKLLPLRVTRVESLRPGWVEPGDFGVSRWLEHIETELPPLASTVSGQGFWYRKGNLQYLGAWPSPDLADAVVAEAAKGAGLALLNLPDDLRIRRRGDILFAINYGPDPIDISSCLPGAGTADFILGERVLPPAGVAAWRET